ncbi:hypothetical protein DFJ73DRAFT_796736 [Zopfochytrium polystomum]|nr:hypothetical protein DFJ73DRAFT_796736 [Zopfochytrium polystomum]
MRAERGENGGHSPTPSAAAAAHPSSLSGSGIGPGGAAQTAPTDSPPPPPRAAATPSPPPRRPSIFATTARHQQQLREIAQAQLDLPVLPDGEDVSGIGGGHYAKPTITRHAHITETPKWVERDKLSRKQGAHATVYMVNGDRYLGEWAGNLKQGNGTYYYSDSGSIYEGGWHADLRSGYGTFSVPPHGKPQPAAFLRKVYAGEWANDRREGVGTYYYEDGSHVYEGEWHCEMRHGQGVLVMPNGDRYEGMWLDDMKEGPGKFIYKTRRQMYEGEWSRGLPKCGTLVDLPPLAGHMPKKYPIPVLELAEPARILDTQREEIQAERLHRMMAASRADDPEM